LGSPLPRRYYARDTVSVARALLGCVLETSSDGKVTAGRIVEVEAYLGPEDPAAHGYGNRQTRRNASMFGPAGTAYVYRSYGLHWCVNVVTERVGHPAAVLIRALEPLVGREIMVSRRQVDDDRLLCAGPGRLCQALAITRAHDGMELQRRPLRVLRQRGAPGVEVAVSRRVGISKATDWPLRFYISGSPWVSRSR
jgi:DNA-3-methyladenine glycosylase